jgi:4-hydroxy-tetrahydrodipicolinate synthase
MTREVPGLKGAFTPLVAPFRNGEVDYDLYAKIIDWQIEQGAQGLLVNATSGEPTTLTSEEKARLIDVAVKASAGRRPVAAGIPAESHAEAVTFLALAEKAGADAIVSARSHRVFRRPRGENRASVSDLSHSGSRGGVGRR